MRRAILGVMTVLVVPACGGDIRETNLKLDCALIMQDSEAVQFLQEAGINGDTMCNCVAQLAAAGTDMERQQTYLTFNRIAEIVRDTGAGVEDTVSELQADAERGTDEDQLMLLAGIDLTERYFEQIGQSFSETGTCPVTEDQS